MSSFAAAAAKVLALRPSPPNAFGWQWQQTMLRIKDPAKSVPFYRDNFGMTLVAHVALPKFKFDLYFLASLPEGTDVSKIDPKSAEAHTALWSGKYGDTDLVTLELTHNYGTESLEGPVYHPGNAMASKALNKNGRDGFGHVAFNVPDVYKICDDLVAKDVPFQKLPDGGRMKGLAFALDPDGYWVEIVKRGESKEAKAIKNAANLSQTMLRIKDPVKSVAFYQHLGMTLLRAAHGPDFSLFFLATLTPDLEQRFAAQVLSITDDEAKQGAAATEFVKSLFIPVLELTWNHGTESDESFQVYSGNESRGEDTCSDGRGFGHIGFVVDDVEGACASLEPLGFGFKKRLGEGGMKSIAFAYDPDGYWIEIFPRVMDMSAFL